MLGDVSALGALTVDRARFLALATAIASCHPTNAPPPPPVTPRTDNTASFPPGFEAIAAKLDMSGGSDPVFPILGPVDECCSWMPAGKTPFAPLPPSSNVDCEALTNTCGTAEHARAACRGATRYLKPSTAAFAKECLREEVEGGRACDDLWIVRCIQQALFHTPATDDATKVCGELTTSPANEQFVGACPHYFSGLNELGVKNMRTCVRDSKGSFRPFVCVVAIRE
jgi:hypothetical protein